MHVIRAIETHNAVSAEIPRPVEWAGSNPRFYAIQIQL